MKKRIFFQKMLPATETKNETAGLTPMASMLFSNVKIKLNDAEKNDLIQKTGITPADSLAITKKASQKLRLQCTSQI